MPAPLASRADQEKAMQGKNVPVRHLRKDVGHWFIKLAIWGPRAWRVVKLET